MVTLYIKTHNKTGLKYFGKTIKGDVHKYKGWYAVKVSK